MYPNLKGTLTMYIPLWLIAIMMGIFCSKYLRKKLKKSDHIGTTEEIWKQAEFNLKTDAWKLRQKFSEDPTKQQNIANDFMKYTNSLRIIKFSREALSVDGDLNRFNEKVRESVELIKQTEARVQTELGEESQLKKLRTVTKIN